MKILSISVAAFEGGADIFGLGDDNKIYYWDTSTADWVLDKSKPLEEKP